MDTLELLDKGADLAREVRERGLPAPTLVDQRSGGWSIVLSSLADLTEWAKWADATISDSEPHDLGYGLGLGVTHSADGIVLDVPVRLSATTLGHMTEPSAYRCERCGAQMGLSGGFVARGEDDAAEHFAAEIARHEAGECTREAVPA